MKLLPIALNVQGTRCLVVGGGKVAARKVAALLECEASVTIVAPQCSAEMQPHLTHCKYLQRAFMPEDCAAQQLVFACTNDAAVNEHIASSAREHGALYNRADDAAHSDFHNAAAIRRGEICIGITTGGNSPALSRHLKQQVEAAIAPEYETLLGIVARRRDLLKKSIEEQSERAHLWNAIFESNALHLLQNGQHDEAVQLIDKLLRGL